MNNQIFEFINSLAGRSSSLDSLMILFANDLLYVVIFLSFILAISLKRRQGLLNILFTLVIAAIGSVAFKFLFNFQRPFLNQDVNLLITTPSNPSFPSFDTAIAFAAASVIFLYQRLLGFFTIILAILVGISRIFVGVHYPGDILAGAFWGMTAATSSYLLSKRISFNFGGK
ncbi:MAG TPA: phosphatase PAP2 family protein [Patescibacteria group bacterium]